MDNRLGAPPRSGWARMVPEILVEDIQASLSFWRDLLGFEIAYQRPEDKFAYLERPDSAQIMLCQRSGEWETEPLERPFGRGVMFQVYVDNVDLLHASVVSKGWPIHAKLREIWRRYGDREGGQREFFVLDPDGYLVMLAQNIGERPLT